MRFSPFGVSFQGYCLLEGVGYMHISYVTYYQVIPQSTISAIENERINLGVEWDKTLALVLKCHPAVLVFPGWEVGNKHIA